MKELGGQLILEGNFAISFTPFFLTFLKPALFELVLLFVVDRQHASSLTTCSACGLRVQKLPYEIPTEATADCRCPLS